MRLPALALATLLLAGCLEGQGGAPSGDADEEARAFGLQVIDTFLAGNKEAFLALLAETTYSLEGEGPYTRADVESFFEREPFPDGRDYRNLTREDFLETYEPEVLTFDEARERYPEFAEMTWPGWEPGENDRIFLGSTLREGKTSIMWDDLLSFAVSREGGAWRFKAFSG